MNYISSHAALKDLRNGSINWNPELEKQAEGLTKLLEKKDPQKLLEELQKQTCERLSVLVENITTLNSSSYTRNIKTPPIIWQQGSTRLLDYGPPASANHVTLFVPSLINRSYILDISKKRSFLRYLRHHNISSYLIDWQDVNDDETQMTIDDYIERLNQAIRKVYNLHKKPITLVGYCMGGLLAIASAMRDPQPINKIALLATPWDYHSKDFPRIVLDSKSTKILEKLIYQQDRVSSNFVQAIFYYLHWSSITQKFEHFSPRDAEEAEENIALQYWANDGISMTCNVWKTCFTDWVQHNAPANGKWKVFGQTVNPCNINAKFFLAFPKRDHIVPPQCAMPLGQKIQNAYIINPNTGHTGMVAGPRAKDQLWDPFINWLRNI